MTNLIWKIGFWSVLTGAVGILSYFIGDRIGTWEGLGFFVFTMAGVLISFWWGNNLNGYWSAGNQWLSAATISMFIATYALAFWSIDIPFMGWLAVIAFLVAVICFLRHKCLSPQHDWCNRFNRWWHTTGWPAVKKSFGVGFSALRIFLRRGLMPMIVGAFTAMSPWMKKNFWLVVSICFGWVAYAVYQESHGWKQSPWFWGTTMVSVIAFLVWSPFTAKLLAKLTDWFVDVFLAGVKSVWANFMDKTSGWGKFWVGAIAALGIAVVSSLVQEIYERNTGWVFVRVFKMNMFEYGRISWSGTLLIASIFFGGVIILMLILPFGEKSKKKDPKKTKEDEKAEKKREADLIKLIRKYRGDEGVAAYKKDKKAGKKFSC